MLAMLDFIMSTEESQIRTTLRSYRTNLVASNAAGCAALYTTDGATMAQNFETQVGKDAIEKWYKLCFSLIALDVEFEIRKVVVASAEYAFARTTSAGTQRKLASGKSRDTCDTKKPQQEMATSPCRAHHPCERAFDVANEGMEHHGRVGEVARQWCEDVEDTCKTAALQKPRRLCRVIREFAQS